MWYFLRERIARVWKNRVHYPITFEPEVIESFWNQIWNPREKLQEPGRIHRSFCDSQNMDLLGPASRQLYLSIHFKWKFLGISDLVETLWVDRVTWTKQHTKKSKCHIILLTFYSTSKLVKNGRSWQFGGWHEHYVKRHYLWSWIRATPIFRIRIQKYLV